MDSNDLREAVSRGEERPVLQTGSEGGAYPRFDVSWQWVPERRQVDLTVRQIQADLPFENDFRLPVDVEIAEGSGTKTHRIELSGWETKVALPAGSRPRRVTFDKGGWLVCEVRYERSIEEVFDELAAGDLAARLRAARQLGDDFGRDRGPSRRSPGFSGRRGARGLRREAAVHLRYAGEGSGASAREGARDRDRQVRRAAAVALGGCGGTRPRGVAPRDRGCGGRCMPLRVSLGGLVGQGRRFTAHQLPRESRWWDAIAAPGGPREPGRPDSRDVRDLPIRSTGGVASPRDGSAARRPTSAPCGYLLIHGRPQPGRSARQSAATASPPAGDIPLFRKLAED